MEDSLICKKNWFVIASDQNIEEYYDLKRGIELGSGAFGKVIMAKKKNSEIYRAVKVILKSTIKKKSNFTNEINILKSLDHPNIIKLYETFQDEEKYYLIFELCKGGELFDTIIENGYFTEKEAKKLFKCIIKALHYCHKIGICHRDIKPENFMFADKTDFESLKMIDFGLSKVIPKKKEKEKENNTGYGRTRRKGRKNMKTKAGTSYYVAPEVLLGEYNEKCDIWSAGVILYILLCGYPPFGGANDWEILLAVKRGKYSFKGMEWKYVSEHAKDLIKKMLCPVDKRFSAQEVLNHPWFEKTSNDVKGEINLSKLKDYVKSNRLKKVVLNYIVTQTDESEIKDLIKLFNKLDVNGDGELTKEEFISGLKNCDGNTKKLARIFKKIDFDQNGSISYTEFISALISKEIYFKESKLKEAFMLFDKDGDGHITFAELRNILGNECNVSFTNQYWKDLVKVADLNGDGCIDYEEFIQLLGN
jgi:calcium-dependent protein kinase